MPQVSACREEPFCIFDARTAHQASRHYGASKACDTKTCDTEKTHLHSTLHAQGPHDGRSSVLNKTSLIIIIYNYEIQI